MRVQSWKRIASLNVDLVWRMRASSSIPSARMNSRIGSADIALLMCARQLAGCTDLGGCAAVHGLERIGVGAQRNENDQSLGLLRAFELDHVALAPVLLS